MRGEKLVFGAASYLKSENDKGFERIFSIDFEENQNFQIQQMISFIKAGIIPYSMLITPNTRPTNLAEILSNKGFVISDKEPCMMMYLDDYKETIYQNDNFTVSDVIHINQLASWLSIVNEALFECELVTLEQFNDILSLENTNFYLGSVDNKPVAACMTIIDGDTSVLEMVATLSEYRRRGFASQVINRALLDLQQKGISTISLRAEIDAISVYKRLGFKESFKKIVAQCDWNTVYKEACPCHIESEKIELAKQIFENTSSVESFVSQMNKQRVIGRDIRYEPKENEIYITKMYACDCNGGCHYNNTVIGQRCHCEYVNHLERNIPISYCKCAASFFEPMFVPLFGENIVIKPVQTVLSGADKCIFRIKLQ